MCQPDGNSQLLRLLDNAVSGDDDGAKKSDGGNSCEDDEEGHLVYHVGLLMKERCMWQPAVPLFCRGHSVDLQVLFLNVPHR